MDLIDLGVSIEALWKQAADLFQISAGNGDGLDSMDLIPE
jgi:hypothetical protein